MDVLFEPCSPFGYHLGSFRFAYFCFVFGVSIFGCGLSPNSLILSSCLSISSSTMFANFVWRFASFCQRQQMWSKTASDSIPQHNRGQYGNRNIVQTPTQQHFFSPAKSQSKPYVIENTGAGKPGSSQLHLISFNCKNIKTCGPINPRKKSFDFFNMFPMEFRNEIHIV
jgi:hypothetical protein